MKKMKKAFAALIASSLLLTSFASVSARIDYNWMNFTSPIADVGFGKVVPPGTYVSSSNPDIQYIFESETGPGEEGKGPYVRWSDGAACTGTGSLFIYGWNSTGYKETVTIKIGTKTEDHKYVISFDSGSASSWNHDFRDYATLNNYGWNEGARFRNNSVWTVTNIGVGEHNTNWTWEHYEATLSTIYDPEINFGAFAWGRVCIDNLMVKDTSGNILFTDNFEADDYEELPDPPEPTEPYKCISFGLYRDGSLVDAVSSDGEYTAKAVLKNYMIEEGLNAQIIAVLRKNGKRVDASASDIVTVSKSGVVAPGTEIQTQITVGDLSDGEYELSAYLWDGLGSMKILLPHKTIGEAVE